jgi:phosphatidylinositol glycan class V
MRRHYSDETFNVRPPLSAKLISLLSSLVVIMFAHIQALFWLYFACKLLLLCIAHVSPGPGYDTSTNLLLLRAQSASSENTLPAAFAKQLVSKLVRWDALYFISVAQRGYLYEQEWAWGWGYTKSLGCLSKGLSGAFLLQTFRG